MSFKELILVHEIGPYALKPTVQYFPWKLLWALFEWIFQNQD